MQPDETPTKVIFRKYPDGDVIALFPTLAGNGNPYTCLSYMHIGQHAASLTNFSNTIAASEAEYRDLKQELESIGYNLLVCTRFTRSDLQERIKQTKG